jgi:3-methyladenine DNA glycosylase/8-oxoguanine DNA glycosylase
MLMMRASSASGLGWAPARGILMFVGIGGWAAGCATAASRARAAIFSPSDHASQMVL